MGRGADITITSPDECDEVRFWGRIRNGEVIRRRRNLIVHNIIILHVGKGDKSLSMRSTYLTVSWCHFIGTDKAILLSWGSSEEDARLDPAMRVTIHHNYFRRIPGLTGKRHECFVRRPAEPRVRFSRKPIGYRIESRREKTNGCRSLCLRKSTS